MVHRKDHLTITYGQLCKKGSRSCDRQRSRKRGSPHSNGPGFAGSAHPILPGLVMLWQSKERQRSQHEINDYLNGQLRKLPRCQSICQWTTNHFSQPAWEVCPCIYVLRAPLPNSGPIFPNLWRKVNTDPTFCDFWIDLKFSKARNCPSTQTEKRQKSAFRCPDVAQTIQLAFAGQRFGYFNTNGRRYSGCSANLNAVIGMSPSTSQPCMQKQPRWTGTAGQHCKSGKKVVRHSYITTTSLCVLTPYRQALLPENHGADRYQH